MQALHGTQENPWCTAPSRGVPPLAPAQQGQDGLPLRLQGSLRALDGQPRLLQVRCAIRFMGPWVPFTDVPWTGSRRVAQILPQIVS